MSARLSAEEQQLEASLRHQMEREHHEQFDDDAEGEYADEEQYHHYQQGDEYDGSSGQEALLMRMNLNGEQMQFAGFEQGGAAAAAAASAAEPAAPAASGDPSHAQQQLYQGSFKLGEAIASTRDVLTCLRCDMGNGHVYAGSLGGELLLFDFTSHREVWRRQVLLPEGKPAAITCLDVNGTRLVLGCSDGLTLIYDLTTFQVVQVWKEHRARVSAVAWVSADSSQPASVVYSIAHDGYFLARDASKQGRIVHSFITCTCPLSALQVESPSVVYVGSWDGQVKRLDLERKLVSLVLKAATTKESPIRALALAPAPPTAGKKKKSAGEEAPAYILVVSHGIGEIKSWDLRNGQVHVECYPVLPGGDVVSALVAWNGRLYAGGDDRCIRMFDLHTGAPLEALQGHGNGITALAIAGVTPVLTPEQEEAAAAAAAATHRSSSRARSAKGAPTAPQQGVGNELLLSTSFDCSARSFKLAAVESGVALKLLKDEEARQAALDAFVASKTKPKKAGSRKGSAKGKKKAGGSSKKKKKAGATATGSPNAGSSSGSKTGSKAGTARGTASGAPSGRTASAGSKA